MVKQTFQDPFIEGLRQIFASRKDITPAGISRAAGLDNSTIRKMLLPGAQSPRMSTALSICRQLDVTLMDVLSLGGLKVDAAMFQDASYDRFIGSHAYPPAGGAPFGRGDGVAGFVAGLAEPAGQFEHAASARQEARWNAERITPDPELQARLKSAFPGRDGLCIVVAPTAVLRSFGLPVTDALVVATPAESEIGDLCVLLEEPSAGARAGAFLGRYLAPYVIGAEILEQPGDYRLLTDAADATIGRIIATMPNSKP